jgi:hypothetical protein
MEGMGLKVGTQISLYMGALIAHNRCLIVISLEKHI